MIYSTVIPASKCYFYWLRRPSCRMSLVYFPRVHHRDTQLD